MKIENSSLNDLARIFELYKIASAYMNSKNQIAWPIFSQSLIETEIKEGRQWKIVIDEKIACIWASTLNDELIWGKENDQAAIYIHRIASNPSFRGRNLVKQIVTWADEYCLSNDLDFIRMDTVGLNQGLINHYQKLGFSFLGTKELKNPEGLPDHYKKGTVCLFQREVNRDSSRN